MVPSERQHPPGDAGLLGDLADGRLLERLVALQVPLGQAPLDPAGPVAAGDDRDPRGAAVDVDDDTAGGRLLHRRQPADLPRRLRDGGAHVRHCNERACRRTSSGSRRLGRGGARHLPLALVSSVRPDQPAPAGGRTSSGPRPADPHRARCPLRRRRARALAGRRPGARRVPRPARHRTWTSPPTRRRTQTEALLRSWADAHWDIGREFGTIGARKRRRRTVVVEVTTYRTRRLRPDHRASRRWRSATPSRATWSGATSPSTRWRCGCRRWSSSTRTAGWPTWPRGVLRTPGHAGGVVRRRPAADDAGGPVRLPARRSPWRPRSRRR